MVLIYTLVLLNARKPSCCHTYIDVPFFADGSLLLSKNADAFERSHNLIAVGCKLNVGLDSDKVLFSIAKIAYCADVPWESITIQVKENDRTYEIFQPYIAALTPEAMSALTQASRSNMSDTTPPSELEVKSTPSTVETDTTDNHDSAPEKPSYHPVDTAAKWGKSKLVLNPKADIVYSSYARFDYNNVEPAIVVFDGYSTAADSWLKALDAVVCRLAEASIEQLERAIKARFYTAYFCRDDSGMLMLNVPVVAQLKPVKMMSIAYHLIAQTKFHPASLGIKCTMLPFSPGVSPVTEEEKHAQFTAMVGSVAFAASTSRDALRLGAEALIKHFGTKITSAFINTKDGRTPALRMKSGTRHTLRLKSGFYLLDGNDFEQHRETLRALGDACRLECDLFRSSATESTTDKCAATESTADAQPAETTANKQSSNISDDTAPVGSLGTVVEHTESVSATPPSLETGKPATPDDTSAHAQQEVTAPQEPAGNTEETPSEMYKVPTPAEKAPTETTPPVQRVATQDRFLSWLCNVANLAENSAKVYRSSMLAISQYAIKEKLTGKILLDMTDPAEMCRIADQLERSAKFLRWDQEHSKRFRPALRKYREFATYLMGTKSVVTPAPKPDVTDNVTNEPQPSTSTSLGANVEGILDAFSRWLAKAENMGSYMRGKHVRALRSIHTHCQARAADGKGLLDLSPAEAMKLIETLLHSAEFTSWARRNVPDTTEILQRYCEYLAEKYTGGSDVQLEIESTAAQKTTDRSPEVIPCIDDRCFFPDAGDDTPPAPNPEPQPVEEKPIPNSKAVIQHIKDADLDGIRFDKLYAQFDLTRAQLQKVIDGDPQVIDIGGLLIHEDALMDWEEAQVLIDAALAKLLGKNNIVSRKLLYDTVCFDLSMFFNDNNLDSEEKLYHLARHMFEKNRYRGKRYWFYSNQNICTQEQKDGVSNLDILADLARSKQGLVTLEEAMEHFKRIGKNAGSLRTQLLTDTKPHFLLYQENTYLSVDALQIDESWYQEASRALHALMEETNGFVILRDVQDGFFDRMPRLPYGLKWNHLLLQQVLRFWAKKLSARTIPAHTGQLMSTLHAFLVAADTDIHTFADGVAVWVALENVEQRRYTGDELRELLRDRGIIAGGELSGILHKALADDSRFAWDHEKETVVVRG